MTALVVTALVVTALVVTALVVMVLMVLLVRGVWQGDVMVSDFPGALPTGRVLAVDHVGVAVADLDVAVAFYRETFGLVESHREVNAEQGVTEAMLAPAAASEGATQVQLLAPLTPDSPIARFISRSGPGLQQLAYRVADVDEAAAALRARGIRVLYDTGRRGTGGTKINFVHPKDAGGVLIELVEVTGTTAGAC